MVYSAINSPDVRDEKYLRTAVGIKVIEWRGKER